MSIQDINPIEKETIRRLLGYPMHEAYTDQIEVRCAILQSQFPESLRTLRAILFEVQRIQQQIKNVRPFAAETFSSSGAGTRQYNQRERIPSLQAEARLQISELADLMEMPIHRDIFSPPSKGVLIRG